MMGVEMVDVADTDIFRTFRDGRRALCEVSVAVFDQAASTARISSGSMMPAFTTAFSSAARNWS